MEKQKHPAGTKSNEEKGNKEVAKITKILKDVDKADQALFELKKMAYLYSGSVVQELIAKETDYESISTMYVTLLEKRTELLANITKLLTKEY